MLLVLLAGLPGLVADVRADVDAPDPDPGLWAPTTLSLLDYNRRQCEGIAQRLVVHWHQAIQQHNASSLASPTSPATPPSAEPAGPLTAEQEERIARDYVLHNTVSDLAAARTAADLINEFMPNARREIGTETVASMQRLFDVQTKLCDLIAAPTGTLIPFQTQVDVLLSRIDTEEGELGRLLVVDDSRLESLLAPYLVPIRSAGVSAEGELRAYLASLVPPPKEPTIGEKLAVWHNYYSGAARPTKEALGRLLRARNAGDTRTLRQACRDLASSVVILLDDRSALRGAPPEVPIGDSLQRAYMNLRSVATACNAGRFREVDKHMTTAQQYLTLAARHMRPYQLNP
ncbi:MAG: hypothetical protein AAF772_11575 [Acidobacteriota bacterium]